MKKKSDFEPMHSNPEQLLQPEILSALASRWERNRKKAYELQLRFMNMRFPSPVRRKGLQFDNTSGESAKVAMKGGGEKRGAARREETSWLGT